MRVSSGGKLNFFLNASFFFGSTRVFNVLDSGSDSVRLVVRELAREAELAFLSRNLSLVKVAPVIPGPGKVLLLFIPFICWSIVVSLRERE